MQICLNPKSISLKIEFLLLKKKKKGVQSLELGTVYTSLIIPISNSIHAFGCLHSISSFIDILSKKLQFHYFRL